MSAELEAARDVGDEPEFPSEGWRIEDLGAADWALQRIADLEREIEENNALARTAMCRLEARNERLNETLARHVEFFRGALIAYAEPRRAELLGSGKKKSRTLLHGSIGWRKVGGQLTVKDRDALLEWARAQPVEKNLLRITEAPAVDEIKLACKLTGEVPPGCDISPEREELVIKAVMTGGADGNAE